MSLGETKFAVLSDHRPLDYRQLNSVGLKRPVGAEYTGLSRNLQAGMAISPCTAGLCSFVFHIRRVVTGKERETYSGEGGDLFSCFCFFKRNPGSHLASTLLLT